MGSLNAKISPLNRCPDDYVVGNETPGLFLPVRISEVSAVLSTANITMQFGPKPLFENISVKFGDGNRYGLIGANGCGKSTFMKILGGDLEPSSGNVMLDANERLGKLRQDQFAFEEMRVLDVVMMR